MNEMNNPNHRDEKDLIEKARQAALKSRYYAETEQKQARRKARLEQEKRRNNLPLVSSEHGNNQEKKRKMQNKRTPSRKNEGREYRQRQVRTERHLSHGNSETSRNIYGYVLAVLLIVLSLVLTGTMWIYNILPILTRGIITAILILLSFVGYRLAGRGQTSATVRKAWNSIATIIVIILLLISYLLLTGVGFLNSLFAGHEKVEFEVRVMNDSPFESMNDLNESNIGVIISDRQEDTEKALTDISQKEQIHLEKSDYENYQDALAELYDGTLDALLFNKAKLQLIKEAYPDFEVETRVLSSIQIKSEIKDLSIGVNTSKESFNLYVSGIDTYGEISSVSRSDVNIVMTVDPQAKEILMTNLPRDTYVEIAGTNGGYDKLTHAGLNGIETSIKTISHFLDTDINYFARVNFTSLIELVDVLGGIELDNPEAFPTNDGKYYFEAGRITLNGDEALAYSRERYNIAEGDIGRGKNQMRVIEAMINKAISPAIITHADELIAKFGDVAETNMPTRDISNLVNAQLSNNQSWKFETQTLIGYGRQDLPSYYMPGSALYMYEPDLDSLNELKSSIQNALD